MKSRKKHGYAVAREKILGLISDAHLRPGELIPSRNALSKKLKIGGTSIQQAIRLLEKEGVLRTVQGSGCYVDAVPRSGAESASSPSARKGPASSELFSGISIIQPKITVRFGIFPGELEDFGVLWRKILGGYERNCGDVSIELVESGLFRPKDLGKILSRNDLDILQLPMSELPPAAESGCIFNPSLAGELEVREGDFFDAYYAGSFHDGVCWGVPLAANSTCIFYNSRCGDLAGLLPSKDGFWRFLDRLAELADEGWLEEHGFESFIANAEGLLGILANSPGALREEDFAWGRATESDDFRKFVEKFERYYKDSRIFHPEVCSTRQYSFENFAAGRSAMSFGNTCWIPKFKEEGFGSWRILPPVHERNGFVRLFGIINTITSSTYHHIECLNLLNYLADREVQSAFAGEGRLVARRDACGHLAIKGLDEESKAILLASFDSGRLIHDRYLYENEFMHVASPTMFKWYAGSVTTAELFNDLRKRKELFDGAVRFRMVGMTQGQLLSAPH